MKLVGGGGGGKSQLFQRRNFPGEGREERGRIGKGESGRGGIGGKKEMGRDKKGGHMERKWEKED